MNIEDLSPRTLRIPTDPVARKPDLVPCDFQHPRLAANLIDALQELRANSNLSYGTADHYKQAILNLLRAPLAELPSNASLASHGPKLVNALYMWESNLLSTYGTASTIPQSHGMRMRRLIKMWIAAGHPTSDQVASWAESPPLHGSGSSTPLDEFSNAERLAIRARCRSLIRAMEDRTAQSRATLETGSDPRTHGWETEANALWGVAHLGRPGMASIEADLNTSALAGPRLSTRRPASTVIAATRRLYPDRLELIAFRTLIQLATGAAPEEISRLTTADIDIEHETVRLRLTKSRAHHARTIHCPTTSASADKGWKSGDLIIRLLRATERARAEVQHSESSPLFLTLTRDTHRRLVPHQVDFHRREFASLLTSIDPPISEPYDARRLRKTVKSVRAVLLRSAELAADDHSVAVFQRHYAQSTTIHVLAGEAVTTAQQQVINHLRSGPTFINAQAKDLTDSPDPVIANAAVTETQATDTDRSMAPAACTDPHQSPFTPAGRLCEHRPTMCFACPNAIVFTDHLPRLLAYRDVLEQQRLELTPQQFTATYGQQLTNLDAVLDQFSALQVERARTELDNTTIHIPLAHRGTHL